jgi:hypothetical protein
VDAEISALAGAAATTLITLLTTEGWQRAKTQFSVLWNRVQPSKSDVIASQIDETHNDLLVAQQDGDISAQRELLAEWQGRFRRILAAHPELTESLRLLLAEIAPDGPRPDAVSQHAVASGQARVFQAGRDQNFGSK